MTSEDIGIAEASDAAVGTSLQLTGLGTSYSDFIWQSGPKTFGSVNTDQFFSYHVFVNEIHYDNDGTDTGESIEIAGPAGIDLTDWTLVLYNGNGGAVYSTINLNGIIPDQDNGYGTLAFATAGIQNGWKVKILVLPKALLLRLDFHFNLPELEQNTVILHGVRLCKILLVKSIPVSRSEAFLRQLTYQSLSLLPVMQPKEAK